MDEPNTNGQSQLELKSKILFKNLMLLDNQVTPITIDNPEINVKTKGRAIKLDPLINNPLKNINQQSEQMYYKLSNYFK